jgi:hypothetical protein
MCPFLVKFSTSDLSNESSIAFKEDDDCYVSILIFITFAFGLTLIGSNDYFDPTLRQQSIFIILNIDAFII